MTDEREIRERFVATLTHDLRTPLAAAKINAQILIRKPGDLAFFQKFARRIINNINRADHMIQDLLDANRIKAGEIIPIKISRCNLNEIASEVIENLSALHGNRFVIDAHSAIEGNWSPDGIRRILENLCNNAIKYGSPLGLVTVSLGFIGSDVELSVHNEGNPILPEDQSILFAPFRRTISAQNSGQKGWGLGLTLVRGIAEAHRGTVKVMSSSDFGTTFQVILPQNVEPLKSA